MMDVSTPKQLEQWLRETDDAKLTLLYEEADRVRRETVGDEVHLRGLIEISNRCVRSCLYCGLRAPNDRLPRYRMMPEEVVEAAKIAKEYGYGTVVLQSGEDRGWSINGLADLIREIKRQTGLAVTLSVGERGMEEYSHWRAAGADRVLLRFETSDSELYERIHPKLSGQKIDRFQLLAELKSLGYELGSGVMVGIPGQRYSTLAHDIELFRELDLDMVGVGPFVPNPDTPLGQGCEPDARDDQVPASVDMALRVVALTRLARPDANIPSTSAIAALDPEKGHTLGLTRGANVMMPNLTPLKYRACYEIYPGKIFADEAEETIHRQILARIERHGRKPGRGRGDRKR
jgi:biotin synthase